MTIEKILEIAPYSLNKNQKQDLLDERLGQLSRFHYEHCPEYAKMCDASGFDAKVPHRYQQLPFLPVRLFKEFDLLSVPRSEIVKTMTSSGTTGQKVSKIYLDRTTSGNQTKALSKIVSSYLGNSRVPMLILDSSEVVKNRLMFSARGAGILGFSMFGTKRQYALDENMNLDIEGIKSFLDTYNSQTIFLFGFTFMVWKHFYQELLKLDKKYHIPEAFLMTGGGWKKLESEAISRDQFKEKFKEICGLQHFLDHYGMVEQTGCIYAECECGHLHASIYSDVIARRPEDFSVCEIGEKGILQVVSVLPHSYPGHSLLTEDEGIVLGEDDCPCGRKGKYIQIIGRIKSAELRGCSDTYAAEH